MKNISDILNTARANGHDRLSEYESKRILSCYGIPVVRETLATDLTEAKAAALQLGYPVVLKADSPAIAHKTETGLIALDLRNEADLLSAFNCILEKTRGQQVRFLVQEMIPGDRELVMGMTRDAQFGPCVMFGIGGIFTETLGDVSFRAAPLSHRDALEMMQEIKGQKILTGIRGMAAVDLDALGKCLVAIGQIGLEHEKIREIDVNPLIIRGSLSVAVDALIVLESPSSIQE